MGENKLLNELNDEIATIAARSQEIPAHIQRLNMELSDLQDRNKRVGALRTFLLMRKEGKFEATDLDDLIVAGNYLLDNGGPVSLIEDTCKKLNQEAMQLGRAGDVATLIRGLSTTAQTKRDFPMADRYRTRDAARGVDADLGAAARAMATRGVDDNTIAQILNVEVTEIRAMLL